MDKFNLTEEDEYAVEIAIDTAYRFLKEHSLSPREIVGLGRAIYALQRMPETTPGISVEYGVYDRFEGESNYIDFNVGGGVFHISPSTPGVLLPLFVTTLLTAHSFA